MDKAFPPTTFGVFKPTGHTLIAFRTQDELRNAVGALAELGFLPDSMVEYGADEMRVLAETELAAASPLANFGYEIDLLRAHKNLAASGCVFLIVHVPSDAQAERVATLVRTLTPAKAQHYGRFLIQDLTERPPA